MPSADTETSAPDTADNLYASATNFLREYTRDKSKYPMVYSDNVAYGFARNLLVMRWMGIGVAFTSIMVNLIFLYSNYAGQSLLKFLNSNTAMVLFGMGATGASLILMLVFAFFLNEGYVYGRAIRYAKSLLAVCEG